MYTNFVKPLTSDQKTEIYCSKQSVSGNEAQKMYLEEVKEVLDKGHCKRISNKKETTLNLKQDHIEKNVNNKDLFRAVQDDDVEKVKILLNFAPGKVNLTDEFGWSLLMIACQANAEETVKELIKRGANMKIYDRAGHTALSLLRKTNKSLYNFLLDNRTEHLDTSSKNKTDDHRSTFKSKTKVKTKNEYLCEICNKVFHDKIEHLSSTIHNINASKGKKITPAFKIPETNKGYQLLLRVGWKKESGLGRQESGKIYPIRTVQKTDRKGLGHDKKYLATKEVQNRSNQQNRKIMELDRRNERILEANFRRQFY